MDTFFDVFDSDVNALGDDATADLLVDDDTEGSLVDIENLACSAVIEFEGHTLVLAGVHFYVHVLSHLIRGQVVLHSDRSCSSERLAEHASCSSS